MLISRLSTLFLAAAVVAAMLLSLGVIEGRKLKKSSKKHFRAINCRKHTAYLTDFGGVGDGKTSNTQAFACAVASLSEFMSDGGAQLVVPAGRWLTRSFNLTSNFTLYLEKDAVILASQDESDWPSVAVLPSYGRGRDAPGERYNSLIFGTNLTDVVITDKAANRNNGTINGQGEPWSVKFRSNQLNLTRPYLIELMYSENIQISNLFLLDSPSWNVHPICSKNIVIQKLTIKAPIKSANTDGINPDSCSNVLIEDCFIVSGDDCVTIKSGWDQYGIRFGMPTEHVVVRRMTCISPFSAGIALGSEMSGGIRDVWAEDNVFINTESMIRIKSAVGRGTYVKDIFTRRSRINTMKYVFWMTGAYGSHPDESYNPKAFPLIEGINYRDIIAENVTYAGRLDGIQGDTFKGFCISNATILTNNPKNLPWNCTDVEGTTSRVTSPTCAALPERNLAADCSYPTDKLSIENIRMKICRVPH